MDENLNHYCEIVIRSPLPIIFRRTFIYVFTIIYFVVQTYACCHLTRWRLGRNQARLNATDHHGNSSSLLNLTRSDGASGPEEIPPLYGHAFAVPLMMSAFLICVFACRVRYQSVYACAVQYANLIDAKDVDHCRAARTRYRQAEDRRTLLDGSQEEELKAVLTWRERGSSFFFCGSFLRRPLGASIDCTLADYMFSRLRYDGSFQILGAIELVHEIMKGMDYLHYRNVYHLDLRPESVKLHCNGRKVYVKLTNFNFMKKAPDKRVDSTSVGLRAFYRPPECSSHREVDAEKCDMWGLGMICLDLFTGGLYRIESEGGEWEERRRGELVGRFTASFCAYLDGTYGVVDMFARARYRSASALEVRYDRRRLGFAIVTEYPYRSYNVCHTSFLHNIRGFVCRLLVFSPRRRIPLQRAFEEPLIQNRKFPRRK